MEWRGELDALVEAERIERVRTAPDLAELARRAELRTVDLWARSRDSPDFLVLRTGLGTLPTSFTPELPRGGDDDLRAEATLALDGLDLVHGVPITVDLADCGVVGAARPRRRGQRCGFVDGDPGGVPAQPRGPHDRRRGR